MVLEAHRREWLLRRERAVFRQPDGLHCQCNAPWVSDAHRRLLSRVHAAMVAESQFASLVAMTTKLTTPLKREIEVAGEPYTVTLTPDGLKLVAKGRRKGYELKWESFVSGDA